MSRATLDGDLRPRRHRARTAASARCIDGQQIAVFRVGDAVHAHRQPRSGQRRQRAVARHRRRPGRRAGRRVADLQAAFQPGHAAAASKTRRCGADLPDAHASTVASGCSRSAQRQPRGRGAPRLVVVGNGMAACARSRNCWRSRRAVRHHRVRRRTAAATTTACCCRRCWPARSARGHHHASAEWYRGAAASRCMPAMPVTRIDRARRVVHSQQRRAGAATTACCSPPARDPSCSPLPGDELAGVVEFPRPAGCRRACCARRRAAADARSSSAAACSASRPPAACCGRACRSRSCTCATR